MVFPKESISPANFRLPILMECLGCRSSCLRAFRSWALCASFSVALILGVSFILFALINAIGNPIQILLAETPGVSEEMIAALSKFYGVDGNFIDRYLSWLWAVVRFDFGTS